MLKIDLEVLYINFRQKNLDKTKIFAIFAPDFYEI